MSRRYLSVCSGIEAATVAWHPYGFSPVAFSEIDAFPSAVLAHYYPHVPNWGDMTRFQEWPDADVDVLVGGTPCQSFSVAGLRRGLADPRGNLALTYLAIADRYRPEWLVWENVPGVLSSSGGRDFGAFLGGLVELGYGFAYRVLDAQYIRVDGFGRAVPQRRRRVFVVGDIGGWQRAAAVLFERESLSGHPAPRREAGQGVAGTIAGGARSGGDVSHCLNAGGMGRVDYETETMIVAPSIAASLTRGAESAGKGGYAGRRQEDDANLVVSGTLGQRTTDHPNGMKSESDFLVPIAFDARQSDVIQYGNMTGPLDTDGHTMAVVAWSLMPQNSGKDFKARAVEVSQPIMAGGPVGGNQGGDYIQKGWAVRRLTPTECERLQGFPDGYTLVPYRNKPAADGPRYKALGNSMAVNAMRWLGYRIDLVERTLDRKAAA